MYILRLSKNVFSFFLFFGAPAFSAYSSWELHEGSCQCMSRFWGELTLSQSTFWSHPTVGGEGGLQQPKDWKMADNSAVYGPIFKILFLWWKLVKIVIDFYSISDFLSFIVWPLEVAEVTKVSRVNFFQQKIQNFQFLARNTWYTSNESWDYVEFKSTTKKYDLIEKNEKKFIFASKTRLTSCLRGPISQFLH